MIKILLIEDEPNIRLNTKKLLEETGYKVFSTDNGSDGIQLAKEIIPNIIICDIMLPGISGYDILKELIACPDTVSVPFIFLTALAEMENLRTGMILGADDYIVKPYKAKELISTIETRVNKAKMLKDSFTNLKQTQVEREIKKQGEYILINISNKPQLIKIKDIICVTAQSEYSKVFLSGGSNFLVCKILKKWEEVLPEGNFIRIHRSTIINLNYVDKIERWYKRSYCVILKELKDNFIISNRYSSKIKEKIAL